MPPWIEYAACSVCAVSGVLAASDKQLDLFGALMLALATALGGGTFRDICLGAYPIFWIQAPSFLTVSAATALAAFFLVRHLRLSERHLNLADAFGLALFGIIGTEKSLAHGAAPPVAVLLGILTGVAGGIVRDVLRDEIPSVFRRDIDLYATAVFGGATVFVLLRHGLPAAPWHRYTGMAVILALRLAALRWRLRLPAFPER